jgi:hypothetical protein
MIRNKLEVLRWGIVSPSPNPQAGGPPIVGCPRLLIQCIRSYHPYSEAVSSIRNPRTRHAMVTGDQLNMDQVVSSDYNNKIDIQTAFFLSNLFKVISPKNLSA